MPPTKPQSSQELNSKSRKELYQILHSKCIAVSRSNRKFFRSLDKQLNLNRRGYGILNEKFKKFQEVCEFGDHLEGLKLEH